MNKDGIDRRVSIAPMMAHTNKHFRYFMRLLSKQTVLYTEMITSSALLHGNYKRLLSFNEIEHPLAIQLGGSDPVELAKAAKMAENEGYDEINLNIGCPSDRVQNGQFGVCLMLVPPLVADCVNQIQATVKIPVTVKTRIGVNDKGSYAFLKNFIQTVSDGGCNTFIIHARKAILKGLSPKENREIPPLNYKRAHKIKRDFPSLTIILNGGINKLTHIQEQLQHVDGVMIGRMAYQAPYTLSRLDRLIFDELAEPLSRQAILEQYKCYSISQIKQGVHPKNLTRHIIGLYQGQPGVRQYRRLLSNTTLPTNNDIEYLQQALYSVS